MLDDFKIFVEIARRKSVSQTAADMGVTVSTLSRRLKALEQELGQSLVLRSSRGVQLTSFGKALYQQHSKTILDLQAALTGSLAATQTEFHFHCPQNIMVGVMYPALVNFQRRFPALQLHIEPVNKNQLLSQQQWDLALRIGEQRSASWYQKRIGSIAIALVRAEECHHPQRLIQPYVAAQIGVEPIRYLNERFSEQTTVNDISLARRLTEDGFGVGVLPMVEIANWNNNVAFRYLDWDFNALSRPVYAMWSNTQQPPALTQTFIELLQQCAESHPATSGRRIEYPNN